MKIKIKHRYTEEVLFSHDGENNNIKIALEAAVAASASLDGASLDFSAFPLWCGSLNIKCDIRLPAQLAYHLCRLGCNDPLFIAARNSLIPLAEKFHRYQECGELIPINSQESEA
jgi:hypothetical protein